MSSRRPNTPFAILGMLRLAPMSGYDIRKESETSVGYFWSESYGQIYPALRELKAQGLIRRHGHAGPARGAGRDRQVYEITERGREALEAWRAEPPRSAPVRSELLLKLFFGRREESARELQWIEARLEQERASLREFALLRKELERERRNHPSLPYWRITLSYGEHHARSVIRWCLESRRALGAMAKVSTRKEPSP